MEKLTGRKLHQMKAIVSWLLSAVMLFGTIGSDLQHVRAAEGPVWTILYKGNPITSGMEIPYGAKGTDFLVKEDDTALVKIMVCDEGNDLGPNLLYTPATYTLAIAKDDDYVAIDAGSITIVPAHLAKPTSTVWSASGEDIVFSWDTPSTTADAEGGLALQAGDIKGYNVELIKYNDSGVGSNTTVASEFVSFGTNNYTFAKTDLIGFGEGKYLADVEAVPADAKASVFATSSKGQAKDMYIVKAQLSTDAGVDTAAFGDASTSTYFFSENTSLSATITATVKDGYTFTGWQCVSGSQIQIADASAATTTISLKSGAELYNITEVITATASDQEAPVISSLTNTDTLLTATASDAQTGIAKGAFSTNEAATDSDLSGSWIDVATAVDNGDGTVTFSQAPTGAGTYYFYAKDGNGNMQRSTAGIVVTKVSYTDFYVNSILQASPYVRYYFGNEAFALETPVRKGYTFNGFTMGEDAITTVSGASLGTAIEVTAHWTQKNNTMTFEGGIDSVDRTYDGLSTSIVAQTDAEFDAISWRWEKKNSDSTWSTVSSNATLTVKDVADSGVYRAVASITLNSRPTPNFEDISEPVSVEIRPATLTITPSEYTLSYGEDAPAYEYAITGYVNYENEGSAGVVVTNTVEHPALSSAYEPWDDTNGVVNTYVITANLANFTAPNYSFVQNAEEKFVTVNAKDVAKSGSGISISLSQDTYTYDGTAKQPAVTVTDTRNGENITEYFDISYTDNIAAGTAAKAVITAKADNHRYTGTASQAFTIQNASFAAHVSVSGTTVSEEKQAWTYGQLGSRGIVVDSVYGSSNQDTIDAFNATVSKTVTYYVSVAPRMVDAFGTESFGAWSAYTVWDSDAILDAGRYRLKATVEVESFDTVETGVVEFIVLPKTIHLTSGSGEKVFDGNPLTNSACGLADGDSLVGTDSFTYVKTTGTITNKGSVSNTIAYKFNGTTNSGNYQVDATTMAGTLTITEAHLMPPSSLAWSLDAEKYGTAAWLKVEKADVNITYELQLFRKNGSDYTLVDNPDDPGSYAFTASTNEYDFKAAILADMQRNTAIGLTQAPDAYVYKIKAISDNANYTDSDYSSNYSAIKNTAILTVNTAEDSGVETIAVTNPNRRTVKDASDKDVTLYYFMAGQRAPITATLETGYSIDEENGVWHFTTDALGCTISNAKSLSMTFSTQKLTTPGLLHITASAKDDLPVIDSVTAVTDNGASPKTTLTLNAHDTRAIKAYAITRSETAPEPGDSAWQVVDSLSIVENLVVPISTFGAGDTLTYYAHIKDATAGNVVTSNPIKLYKISFENGDSSATGTMTAIMKAQNETVALPSLGYSLNGFSFKNWHATQGSVYTDGGDYKENQGTVLTATWTNVTHTYTVKYHYQQTDGTYNDDGSVELKAAENEVVPSSKYITLSTPTGMQYDSAKTKIDSVLVSGSDDFTMLDTEGRTIDVYYNRNQWELNFRYEILDGAGNRVGGLQTWDSASRTVFYDDKDQLASLDDEAIKTAILAANPGYNAGGWAYSGTGTKPSNMPNHDVTATLSLTPKMAEYEIRYWYEELSTAPRTSDAEHKEVNGKYYALNTTDTEVSGGRHKEQITVSMASAKERRGFTLLGYKVGGAETIDSSAVSTTSTTKEIDYNDKLIINYFYTRNSYTITTNVWYENRTSDSNLLKTVTSAPMQYGAAITAADYENYFETAPNDTWKTEGDMETKLNGHYLATYADWSTGDTPSVMPASNISVSRDYVKKQNTVKYYLEVYMEQDLMTDYSYPVTPNYKFSFDAPEGTTVSVVDGKNKPAGATEFDYSKLGDYIYYSLHNYRFAGEWNNEKDDYDLLGLAKPNGVKKGDSRNTHNVLSVTVSESNTAEENTLRIYLERTLMNMTIKYQYSSGGGLQDIGTLTYQKKWRSGVKYPIYPALLFDGIDAFETRKTNKNETVEGFDFTSATWDTSVNWDAFTWKPASGVANIDFRNEEYVVSFSGTTCDKDGRHWPRNTFGDYDKLISGPDTEMIMSKRTDWWPSQQGTNITVTYTKIETETYYVEPVYYSTLQDKDKNYFQIGESKKNDDYALIKVPYDAIDFTVRIVNSMDVYVTGSGLADGYVHDDRYPGADKLPENIASGYSEPKTIRSDFGTYYDWASFKNRPANEGEYSKITLSAPGLADTDYLVKHLSTGFVIFDTRDDNKMVKGSTVSVPLSLDGSVLGKQIKAVLEGILNDYQTAHEALEDTDPTKDGNYDCVRRQTNGYATNNMRENGRYSFYFEHYDAPFVQCRIGGREVYTVRPKNGATYVVGDSSRVGDIPEGYELYWYTDSACTNPVTVLTKTMDTNNHVYYGQYERKTLLVTDNVYYELANGTTADSDKAFITRNDVVLEDGHYYLNDVNKEELTCKVTYLPNEIFKNGRGVNEEYAPEVHTYSYMGEVVWIETIRRGLSFNEINFTDYKAPRHQRAGFTCDDKNPDTIMAGYALADPVHLEVFYVRNIHTITVTGGDGYDDFVPYVTEKGVGGIYSLPVITRDGYTLTGWKVYENYSAGVDDGTEVTGDRQTALKFNVADGKLISFAMPENNVRVKPIWTAASLSKLETLHVFMSTHGSYKTDLVADLLATTHTASTEKIYLDGSTTPVSGTVYYSPDDDKQVIGVSITTGTSTAYYELSSLDAEGKAVVSTSDMIFERLLHDEVDSEQLLTLKDYRLDPDASAPIAGMFQLEKVAFKSAKGDITTKTKATVETGATMEAEYGMTITYYYARERYDVTLLTVSATGDAVGFTAKGAQTYYYGEEVAVLANMQSGYDFLGWFNEVDTQLTGAGVVEYDFVMPAKAVTLKGKSKPNLTVLDSVTLVNSKGDTHYIYGYKDEIGNAITLSLNGLNANAQITGYQWYEVDGDTATEILGATAATYHFPQGKDAGTYTYRCVVTLMRTDNKKSVKITSSDLPVYVDPASMGVTIQSYDATYDGTAHGLTISVKANESGFTTYYATEELTDETFNSVLTKQTTPLTYKDVIRVGDVATGAIDKHTVYVYLKSTNPNYKDAWGSGTVRITPVTLHISAGGTSYTKVYDGTDYLDMNADGTEYNAPLTDKSSNKYTIASGTCLDVQGVVAADKADVDAVLIDFNARFNSRHVYNATKLTLSEMKAVLVFTDGEGEKRQKDNFNYLVDTELGQLDLTATITAKEVTAAWGSTTSFPYDHESHIPTLNLDEDEIAIVDRGHITLSAEGAQTNADSYVANAQISIDSCGMDHRLDDYKISTSTCPFTITPMPLSVTPISKTVTYDGTDYKLDTFKIVAGTAPSTVDFTDDNGEIISSNVSFWSLYECTSNIAGSGKYFEKNQGTYTVNAIPSTFRIKDGLGKDITENYAVTWNAGTLEIQKRDIWVVSGISASNKMYDGSTDATLDVSGVVFAAEEVIAGKKVGLVLGESLGLDAAKVHGSFADAGVGADKPITITYDADALTGATAGNYNLLSTKLAGSVSDVIPTTAVISNSELLVSMGNMTVYYGEALTLNTVYKEKKGASVIDLPARPTRDGDITGDFVYEIKKGDAVVVANYSGEPITLEPGTYGVFVKAGTTESTNYTIVCSDAAGTLTVNKRPVTITANGVVSKTYDGTNAALDKVKTGDMDANGNYALQSDYYAFAIPTPATTFTQAIVGTDDVTVTVNSASFDTTNVGTGKTVTLTGLVLAGEKANYYTLVKPDSMTTAMTSLEETGTITKATLTVTADKKTISYGAAVPTYTWKFSGFQNEETKDTVIASGDTRTFNDVLECVCGYEANATNGHVGEYDITPQYKSGITAEAIENYTLKFTKNKVVVEPAVVTITAEDKSSIFGAAALPENTISFSGAKYGQDVRAMLTAVDAAFVEYGYSAMDGAANTALSTYVTTSSPAGTYAIWPKFKEGIALNSSEDLKNYSFQFAKGTLTVTKRDMLVAIANGGTIADKVYDGTTNVPESAITLTISNLFSGSVDYLVTNYAATKVDENTVTISAAKAKLIGLELASAFPSKDVKRDSDRSVLDYTNVSIEATISPLDENKYYLSERYQFNPTNYPSGKVGMTATAKITPAPLSIKALVNDSQIQYGTELDGFVRYQFSGLMSADSDKINTTVTRTSNVLNPAAGTSRQNLVLSGAVVGKIAYDTTYMHDNKEKNEAKTGYTLNAKHGETALTAQNYEISYLTNSFNVVPNTLTPVVAWDTGTPGKVAWDASGVPSIGYGEGVITVEQYEVGLYKDGSTTNLIAEGQRIISDFNTPEKRSLDLRSLIRANGSGSYVFKVTAVPDHRSDIVNQDSKNVVQGTATTAARKASKITITYADTAEAKQIGNTLAFYDKFDTNAAEHTASVNNVVIQGETIADATLVLAGTGYVTDTVTVTGANDKLTASLGSGSDAATVRSTQRFEQTLSLAWTAAAAITGTDCTVTIGVDKRPAQGSVALAATPGRDVALFTYASDSAPQFVGQYTAAVTDTLDESGYTYSYTWTFKRFGAAFGTTLQGRKNDGTTVAVTLDAPDNSVNAQSKLTLPIWLRAYTNPYTVRLVVTATRKDNGESITFDAQEATFRINPWITADATVEVNNCSDWVYSEARKKTASAANNPGSTTETIYFRAAETADFIHVDKADFADWQEWDADHKPTEVGNYMVYIQVDASDDFAAFYTQTAHFDITPKQLAKPAGLAFAPSATSPIGMAKWNQVDTLLENNGATDDSASSVVPSYGVALYFVPDSLGSGVADSVETELKSTGTTTTLGVEKAIIGDIADSAAPSVDLSSYMTHEDSGVYILCIQAKPTDGSGSSSTNGTASDYATHKLQATTGAKIVASGNVFTKTYDKDGITLTAKTNGGADFASGATYVWHYGTGTGATVDLSETGNTITIKNVSQSGYYTCEVVDVGGEKYYTGTKQVTIEQRKISLVPDSASKVYDGTALTKNTWKFVDVSNSNTEHTGLVSGTGYVLPTTGDTITATVSGSITYYDETGAASGVKQNAISACTITNSGNDVAANYTYDIATNKGSLTIIKRPIDILAAGDNKHYDGTALTHSNLSLEARLAKISDATAGQADKGLVHEDVFANITLTGEVTTVAQGNVDNVPSSVVIKNAEGTRDVTACYNPDYKKGTLYISKNDQTITATATSKVYDNAAAVIAHDTTALEKDQAKTVTYYEATLTKDGDGNITGVTPGSALAEAPKNVGSYCIQVSYGGNSNYNAAVSSYVGYEITKADQVITAPGETIVYNGADRAYSKATVTGVAGGSACGSLSYSYKDAENNSVTAPKAAGTYTVTITAAETADYKAATSTATLIIQKREITIATGSASKKYDRSALTESGWTVTAPKSKNSDLAADASFTPVGNVASLYNDKITLSITGTATNVADTATDNNTFTVVSILDGSDVDVSSNYIVSEAPGTLTITAKPISDAEISVADLANETYDGTAKTPATTVTFGGYTLTSSDYSQGYTSNIDAGTATITLTGIGNYSGTTTKTFVIDKRAITVKPKDQAARAYNGKAQTVTGVDNVAIVSGSLAANQSFSAVTFAGGTTDVATVTISIADDTLKIKRDSDSADVTVNYAITLNTNTLTVAPIDATVTLPTEGSVDVTYNGTAQSFTGATVTGVSGGTAPTALTYYYKLGEGAETTVAPTHAGTYTVRVVSEASTNYNKVERSTTWEIIPAAITLTGTNAATASSKVQTEAHHVFEHPPMTAVDTFVTGTIYGSDDLNIQTKRYYPGTTDEVTMASLPGTYRIVPIYDTSNTDYIVTVVEGVYKIWNKDMAYTITPNNREYDSSTQPAVTTSVTNPPEGAVVYYSLTESLTDSNYATAGSTTIPSIKNADSYTVYYCIVAENYNVETGSVSVTISAKPVTLTAKMAVAGDSAESIYLRGLKAVTSVVTSGSICSGDDLQIGAQIQNSSDVAMTDAAPVGTYRIVPTYDTANTNYRVSLVEDSYQVKAETLAFTKTPYEGVYDAAAHAVVSFDFTKPSAGNGNTVKIYYGTTPITALTTLTSDMLTVPTVTEVGEQTIYYYIVTEDVSGICNYVPEGGSFTAKVTKASTGLTLAPQEKDYTGSNVVYDGHTVSGVSGGNATGAVTITYKLQGAAEETATTTAPITAGIYDVKVVVAGNDTYSGAQESTTLTIRKIADTVVVVTDLTKDYDGVAVENPATVTRSGDGTLSFTYYDATYAVLDSKPVDAGTYYVKATSAEGTNYLAQTSDFKMFIINQIAQTITAADKNVEYNGEEQEILASAHENPVLTYTYRDVSLGLPATTQKPVKPGVYEVVITAAATTNYLATDDANKKVVTLTIEKANVTIAADSAERQFNGEELKKATCHVTSGAIGTGDVIECTMTSASAITEVGSVDNQIASLIIKRGEDDVTAYYNITLEKGTLTVLPSEYDLAITKDLNKPYDGKPVATLEQYDVEGIEPLNPAIATFVFYKTNEDGSHTELAQPPVNAGKYAVRAFAAANTNFAASSSAFYEFTIEQLEDTVTIQKTLSKKADGKPVSLTEADIARTGTGAVSIKYYTLQANATYKELTEAPKEIGVYYVKVSVESDGNYKAAETGYVKFAISNLAINVDGEPGQPVKVSIQIGVNVVAQVEGIVGPDGIFVAVFDEQQDGVYNIVVETDDYKETRGMTVADGAIVGEKTTTFTVPMPTEGKTNSYVEMKKTENVGIAVSRLHDLFENASIYAAKDKAVVDAKGSVDIVLLVDKVEEKTISAEIQNLIVKNGKQPLYCMDIALEKRIKVAGSTEYVHDSYIRDTTKEYILEICIPLPEQYLGMEELSVYRRHEDGTNSTAYRLEEMKNLGKRAVADASGAYPEEGFAIEGKYVFIYSHLFSEYVIAGKVKPHQDDTPTNSDALPKEGQEIIKSPKTGEEDFWAWLLAMLASGTSLAVLGLTSRRKKKEVL